jgi:hypothetical protein
MVPDFAGLLFRTRLSLFPLWKAISKPRSRPGLFLGDSPNSEAVASSQRPLAAVHDQPPNSFTSSAAMSSVVMSVMVSRLPASDEPLVFASLLRGSLPGLRLNEH